MSGAHRVLSPNESDPAAAGICALAIMTKAPRAGQVKTRLTPPLTPEEAAALNICFLRDTAAAISRAGEGTRGIGCYTPAGAEEAYRAIFPASFQLIAQHSEDFGRRLLFATQDMIAVGFASVCLIDSDSPTVPAETFTEAAKVLAQPNDKVVLGPSDDGGYYLIGLKKAHCRMFEEIDWSTDRVLEQTLERASELGIEVHLLPVCFDVDDRATLHRLCAELLGPNEHERGKAAPATQKFLQDLVAGEGRTRIWPAALAALPS